MDTYQISESLVVEWVLPSALKAGDIIVVGFARSREELAKNDRIPLTDSGMHAQATGLDRSFIAVVISIWDAPDIHYSIKKMMSLPQVDGDRPFRRDVLYDDFFYPRIV